MRAVKYCIGLVSSLGKSRLMEGASAWSSPSISSFVKRVGSSPHAIRLLSVCSTSVFSISCSCVSNSFSYISAFKDADSPL